ncbi:hypothetical protein HQ590_05300 [bacterium]|nr:hypothetical protein [bacterium]
MIWLRRLIIGVPFALLAFFALAFISVRLTPPRALNQLTIGVIGEAKILNPLLATTTADSEVLDLVFNGLIRYSEDIEIEPDLAERWEITQTSTLFFPSPAAATGALARIESARGQWPAWHLTAARQDGTRVVLRLSEAGTSFTDSLRRVLGDAEAQPVAFVRVRLDDDVKLADQPATASSLVAALEPAIRRRPDLADRYHSAFINFSQEFDLVVAGDAQPFVELVQQRVPGATVAVAETFPMLNEPEILFELRRGVRWHDGKPFSAGDVEFTYQALMDETVASPRRSDYELVRFLTVLDDHRLRVVYRQPYAPCLLSWGIGMLPRHLLAGKPTSWWAAHFNRSPVGTGPFRFDAWLSNQYIRLRRNDDYHEGRPSLEFVTIRVIPDLVALRLLFETGETDFWGVQAHAIKSFLDNPRYDIFSVEAPAFEYIGWNLRRPLFQDVRVRRALAHAVNVKQMIDYIHYGQGVQSTGPFPPQMWYFNPHVPPYVYDPAKAKALLAEAGWRPGSDGILQKDGQRFAFTLITNHPNEVRKDIATLAQSDLKKIGIEVEVQLYEWAVFISEHINKLDFDATVLGWSLSYDYDQYQLWHSSQAKPERLNHCSYQNPEVDRLLELARGEFDQDKARDYLWRLQQIIYEDQPYLFTMVPRSTGAMHAGEFRVRRPDGAGGWIEEPVRGTKRGFRVYQAWWYRPALEE